MSTRCAETAGTRPAPALCDGAAATPTIGDAPISTGRKTHSRAAPFGAGTLPDGANLGSFSHLKIRLAFIEYRRATCATETPGVNVCSQIERFSSSDQSRFFKPFFPAITNLKMSTIDGGHYHPLHRPGRAVRPDGYDDLKGAAAVCRRQHYLGTPDKLALGVAVGDQCLKFSTVGGAKVKANVIASHAPNMAHQDALGILVSGGER